MPKAEKRGNASYKHEQVVREKLQEMKKDGWRVIRMTKMPDLIAVKGNQIIAVEIGQRRHKRSPTGESKGWPIGGGTKAHIRRKYSMFDKVIIVTFKNGKQGWITEDA